MAPNRLRIRRRSSGTNGPPLSTSLYNAELAFNEVDDTLYYGKGYGAGINSSSVIAIAGPGAFVDRSTNQTIAGTKTFTFPVVVPDPVNSLDAANKQWVLANVGSSNNTGGFAYYYIDGINLVIPIYRIMITPQLEIAGTGSIEIQGALEIR